LLGPWYLLSGGIVLIIVGYFLATLARGSGRHFIHPKMSDKEIERILSKRQESRFASLVMLIGLLAILVSIVWRLVLKFL
jgi:hypothetical protein